MCDEFSRCYNDDVNICLWTDGQEKKRADAHKECADRNSFLPRVTNSKIQDKLREFRSAEKSVNGRSTLLEGKEFWIDVNATNVTDFHWIDGSSLAGHLIYECVRSAYIRYENTISYVLSKDVCPVILP